MTTWLDPREMRAWRRFSSVLELLPGVLETQLKRDSDLTHFEYWVVAILSEAPNRTLRMSTLARHTSGTLPRLSHVVKRLEKRGLVERTPHPDDARVTNAHLTDAGWDLVVAAAPGHVATVRESLIDALTPEQLDQLAAIGEAILGRIAPEILPTLDDHHD